MPLQTPELSTIDRISDKPTPIHQAPQITRSKLLAPVRELKDALTGYRYIDDEFRNGEKAFSVLKPLEVPLSEVVETSEVIQGELADEFEYQSRTKKLEFNTPKTQFLEREVINKMTEGTGIQTRVVIIHKSEGPNAFVYPDGTIFITQSALNQLNSLDEVAALVAHELGHLIYRTSFLRQQTENEVESRGVSWIHEGACDHVKAAELLEKADFSTMAFSTMIMKISPHGRGSSHQTGLTRAAQSIAAHMAVNRITSNNEQRVMPEILRGEVEKSNLEIVQALMSELTIAAPADAMFYAMGQNMEHILDRLHPRDLWQVSSFLKKNKSHTSTYMNIEKNIKYFDNFIVRRLQGFGYSRDEARLFTLLNRRGNSDYASSLPIDAHLMQTPEDVTEMVNTLGKFESEDMFSAMFSKVFLLPGPKILPVKNFLNMMSYLVYDADFPEAEGGMPVTRESLFSNLETIAKLPAPEREKALNYGSFHRVIVRYVLKTFLTSATENNSMLDEGQLVDFFQEAKERNLIKYPESLNQLFSGLFSIGEQMVSEENIKIIQSAIRQVFEIGEKSYTEESINLQLEEYLQLLSGESRQTYINSAQVLNNLIATIQGFAEYGNLTDEQKLSLARSLSEKIDKSNLNSDVSIQKLLLGLSIDRHRQIPVSDEEQSVNDALIKYNLQSIIGISLFKNDTPQFYEFINETMRKIETYTGNFSLTQLANLCQPLFATFNDILSSKNLVSYGKNGMELTYTKTTLISSFEMFQSLSLIRRMVELASGQQFSNLAELNNYLDSMTKNVYLLDENRRDAYDFSFNIFSDGPMPLILGKSAIESFNRLVQQGIVEEDYGQLYQFLSRNYPATAQRETFLRELNKLYLRSPKVPFEQKMDYLFDNLNTVGPEGILILSEQITELKDYLLLRERLGGKLDEYMEGRGGVGYVAIGDHLSSAITGRFETLFNSSKLDPESRKKQSTDLAQQWFSGLFGYYKGIEGQTINGVEYDYDRKKFKLTEIGRRVFRTISDSFDLLKSLTPFQRTVIALKALTDTNGGLTSVENRKKMAQMTVDALSFKKGFISSVIRAAFKEADPKLLAVPIARMTSGLLFRGIDPGNIDYKQLANLDIRVDPEKKVKLRGLLSMDEILTIVKSQSRSVSHFGAGYIDYPDSAFALLSQTSDQGFNEINAKLNLLFNPGLSETQSVQESLDQSVEAIINAVESGGAVASRGLQLSSQYNLEGVSPEVRKRLSQSLDSNEGLNKLLFWENLYKYSLEDDSVAAFIQRIRLGDKAGGGSLQTTYEAIYFDDEGEAQEIVVKMINPNAETFIDETASSAHKTLKAVSRSWSAGRNTRRLAKIGMMIIDLSKKWCKKDINDTEFEKNDDLFRPTIEGFNRTHQDFVFHAPDRIFTSRSVKAEKKAKGRTVNKLLNDPNVDNSIKQRVVRSLSQFFIHQLKSGEAIKDEGREYILAHSDPHIGNYMIDASRKIPEVGVIDRSMFLKLNKADVAVLEKMIVAGNDNAFVYGFLDHVLGTHHVGSIRREIINKKVFAQVGVEYIKQRVRGGIDRLALMQTMLTGLSDSGVEVPLPLRLMIRNISAFQELGRRYGVDFETLYKEAT